MNTLMNILGGMAAVADAVAPIALICIMLFFGSRNLSSQAEWVMV